MKETERNLAKNNKAKLTIAHREVHGKMYKETGFLIKGTARFISEGVEFDMMKIKFPWLRSVLEITIESTVQTL